MAIIINYEDVSGIVLTHAYCRVESVALQQLADKQMFTVAYYKDEQAYTDKKAAFRSETFFFDYDPVVENENPYQAAYLHLKTLERFAGALDI